MQPFEAIRAFLGDVRSQLFRRAATRTACYALAALVLVFLVGPLAAAWSGATRARGIAHTTVALSLAIVCGAMLVAAIAPRLRWRDDLGVARFVGGAAPAVRSDLLSTVELEGELDGEPTFSRELAGALAASTAARVGALDAAAIVPGPRRLDLAPLGAALAAYAIFVVAVPRELAGGWARLLAPPPAPPRLEAITASEPIVGDITLELTYPAYTGRPPLAIPASTGDIVAPRGTRIGVETTALRPAATAKMVFDGTPPAEIPLAVDAKTLRGAFTVDKPAQFRFWLAPPRGTAVVEAEPHRVEVEPDRAPNVTLVAPADELDVSSHRQVELAWSVDDDYGIGEISLVWKDEGTGKEERKTLRPEGGPAGSAGGGAKRSGALSNNPGARTAQGKFLWDLSEISIPPGSTIAYHLEAKDNDDVGGPNVGVSKTFKLRLYSDRERHEEVIDREQQLLEESLMLLGDRLEDAAEDLPAHHTMREEGEKLVADFGAVLGALAEDKLAAKGLAADLDAMHARLEKLAREEGPLLAGLDDKSQSPAGIPKTALAQIGDFDRRDTVELERDTLALDDWLGRQRMEEMLAISDDIADHKQRLGELLDKFARSRSDADKQAIEREIRAIQQQLAELEAKRSKLAGEVADRFVNSDAVAEQDDTDCFDDVRKLVEAGDAEGAKKAFERCAAFADAARQSLEQGLGDLRGERFPQQEKALRDLMDQVSDLQKQQQQISDEADELERGYKKRAADAARQRSSPQKEKAQKTLERLRHAVDDVPHDSLSPFSQEERDAVIKRLDDTKQMLDDGDVAEALSMAKHAEEGLKNINGDVEDDVGENHPWSDRSSEALEKVSGALPLAHELVEELQQATPSPEEIMSPGERGALKKLQSQQQQLAQKARQLGDKAGKDKDDLPGGAGPFAQQGLGEAADQMGRGAERMGANDPMGSHEEAQGAADKLGKLRGGMQQAARPSQSQQQGNRGLDDETVKIPGSDQYKPSEEFREDIIDAMKKEKPPDTYKDQVKRYYEELVK